MSGFCPDGWVPFRLYGRGGAMGVEWCYMGSRRFTDPFFETTMHFEVQTPFNSLFRFRTPLAALGDWHATRPGLKPTGFIFHLSRCGSTLITQLLASLPQNVVLSEPGLLGAMMQAHLRVPEASVEQRVRWLQWLVSALGQPRTGMERHLFIKFDPTNILEFPLVRMAFPDVPWIFVYRDPVEVMVSHVRAAAPLVTRGMISADRLGLELAQIAGMDDEEYAARVLGMIAEAAWRHASASAGTLVHYEQLPELVWSGLERHFGIEFTAMEQDQLKRIATFDAKHPKKPFTKDTEEKNKEATDRLRILANEWIVPQYRMLEELRARQRSAA
jgi:hypothetical protein